MKKTLIESLCVYMVSFMYRVSNSSRTQCLQYNQSYAEQPDGSRKRNSLSRAEFNS